ncbi:hypothetical protein GALL_487690 [mine drainage metagenome]|uniref:Uncharacterized protein n=1 Tax=mine drainage metagenome TaxID=410659 RepID=A0A1J5PWE5_9ZZZZ
METVGLFPSEQYLRSRASLHRKNRPNRDRIAEAGKSFGGGHTDTLIALAPVQLSALARGISERIQGRHRNGDQSILASRSGQLHDAWPENEPALEIARDDPVML